jgi:hypothetical protein
MGLQYYYGGILARLPSLRYALVETETLLRDTNCILASWFARDVPLARMPTLNVRYARNEARFAYLQPAHWVALQRALQHEYEIRDTLRAHASRMDCPALSGSPASFS